jgi:LysR family glycine cleavage system transcriptional activator
MEFTHGPSLPPLSSLRPFEAAARLESFTRAAEELALTHGAVSHQVRALEEYVGAPLFSRHGKRVALTPAGRAFAERVRGALDEIAQAAEQLRTRRDDRLTVSVLPSFASRWLMPRLIRFMDAHPKIEVNVIASTALANFRDDEIDVAIRFGGGPWPPHVCEVFLEDEYFPVASPKLNGGKLPKTPRDLLATRIIREDRDYWKFWFDAGGRADRGGEGGARPALQRLHLCAAGRRARRGHRARAPLDRRRGPGARHAQAPLRGHRPLARALLVREPEGDADTPR